MIGWPSQKCRCHLLLAFLVVSTWLEEIWSNSSPSALYAFSKSQSFALSERLSALSGSAFRTLSTLNKANNFSKLSSLPVPWHNSPNLSLKWSSSLGISIFSKRTSDVDDKQSLLVNSTISVLEHGDYFTTATSTPVMQFPTSSGIVKSPILSSVASSLPKRRNFSTVALLTIQLLSSVITKGQPLSDKSQIPSSLMIRISISSTENRISAAKSVVSSNTTKMALNNTKLITNFYSKSNNASSSSVASSKNVHRNFRSQASSVLSNNSVTSNYISRTLKQSPQLTSSSSGHLEKTETLQEPTSKSVLSLPYNLTIIPAQQTDSHYQSYNASIYRTVLKPSSLAESAGKEDPFVSKSSEFMSSLKPTVNDSFSKSVLEHGDYFTTATSTPIMQYPSSSGIVTSPILSSVASSLPKQRNFSTVALLTIQLLSSVITKGQSLSDKSQIPSSLVIRTGISSIENRISAAKSVVSSNTTKIALSNTKLIKNFYSKSNNASSSSVASSKNVHRNFPSQASSVLSNNSVASNYVSRTLTQSHLLTSSLSGHSEKTETSQEPTSKSVLSLPYNLTIIPAEQTGSRYQSYNASIYRTVIKPSSLAESAGKEDSFVSKSSEFMPSLKPTVNDSFTKSLSRTSGPSYAGSSMVKLSGKMQVISTALPVRKTSRTRVDDVAESAVTLRTSARGRLIMNETAVTNSFATVASFTPMLSDSTEQQSIDKTRTTRGTSAELSVLSVANATSQHLNMTSPAVNITSVSKGAVPQVNSSSGQYGFRGTTAVQFDVTSLSPSYSYGLKHQRSSALFSFTDPSSLSSHASNGRSDGHTFATHHSLSLPISPSPSLVEQRNTNTSSSTSPFMKASPSDSTSKQFSVYFTTAFIQPTPVVSKTTRNEMSRNDTSNPSPNLQTMRTNPLEIKTSLSQSMISQNDLGLTILSTEHFQKFSHSYNLNHVTSLYISALSFAYKSLLPSEIQSATRPLEDRSSNVYPEKSFGASVFDRIETSRSSQSSKAGTINLMVTTTDVFPTLANSQIVPSVPRYSVINNSNVKPTASFKPDHQPKVSSSQLRSSKMAHFSIVPVYEPCFISYDITLTQRLEGSVFGLYNVSSPISPFKTSLIKTASRSKVTLEPSSTSTVQVSHIAIKTKLLSTLPEQSQPTLEYKSISAVTSSSSRSSTLIFSINTQDHTTFPSDDMNATSLLSNTTPVSPSLLSQSSVETQAISNYSSPKTSPVTGNRTTFHFKPTPFVILSSYHSSSVILSDSVSRPSNRLSASEISSHNISLHSVHGLSSLYMDNYSQPAVSRSLLSPDSSSVASYGAEDSILPVTSYAFAFSSLNNTSINKRPSSTKKVASASRVTSPYGGDFSQPDFSRSFLGNTFSYYLASISSYNAEDSVMRITSYSFVSISLNTTNPKMRASLTEKVPSKSSVTRTYSTIKIENTSSSFNETSAASNKNNGKSKSPFISTRKASLLGNYTFTLSKTTVIKLASESKHIVPSVVSSFGFIGLSNVEKPSAQNSPIASLPVSFIVNHTNVASNATTATPIKSVLSVSQATTSYLSLAESNVTVTSAIASPSDVYPSIYSNTVSESVGWRHFSSTTISLTSSEHISETLETGQESAQSNTPQIQRYSVVDQTIQRSQVLFSLQTDAAPSASLGKRDSVYLNKSVTFTPSSYKEKSFNRTSTSLEPTPLFYPTASWNSPLPMATSYLLDSVGRKNNSSNHSNQVSMIYNQQVSRSTSTSAFLQSQTTSVTTSANMSTDLSEVHSRNTSHNISDRIILSSSLVVSASGNYFNSIGAPSSEAISPHSSRLARRIRRDVPNLPSHSNGRNTRSLSDSSVSSVGTLTKPTKSLIGPPNSGGTMTTTTMSSYIVKFANRSKAPLLLWPSSALPEKGIEGTGYASKTRFLQDSTRIEKDLPLPSFSASNSSSVYALGSTSSLTFEEELQSRPSNPAIFEQSVFPNSSLPEATTATFLEASGVTIHLASLPFRNRSNTGTSSKPVGTVVKSKTPNTGLPNTFSLPNSFIPVSTTTSVFETLSATNQLASLPFHDRSYTASSSVSDGAPVKSATLSVGLANTSSLNEMGIIHSSQTLRGMVDKTFTLSQVAKSSSSVGNIISPTSTQQYPFTAIQSAPSVSRGLKDVFISVTVVPSNLLSNTFFVNKMTASEIGHVLNATTVASYPITLYFKENNNATSDTQRSFVAHSPSSMSDHGTQSGNTNVLPTSILFSVNSSNFQASFVTPSYPPKRFSNSSKSHTTMHQFSKSEKLNNATSYILLGISSNIEATAASVYSSLKVIKPSSSTSVLLGPLQFASSSRHKISLSNSVLIPDSTSYGTLSKSGSQGHASQLGSVFSIKTNNVIGTPAIFPNWTSSRFQETTPGLSHSGENPSSTISVKVTQVPTGFFPSLTLTKLFPFIATPKLSSVTGTPSLVFSEITRSSEMSSSSSCKTSAPQFVKSPESQSSVFSSVTKYSMLLSSLLPEATTSVVYQSSNSRKPDPRLTYYIIPTSSLGRCLVGFSTIRLPDNASLVVTTTVNPRTKAMSTPLLVLNASPSPSISSIYFLKNSSAVVVNISNSTSLFHQMSSSRSLRISKRFSSVNSQMNVSAVGVSFSSSPRNSSRKLTSAFSWSSHKPSPSVTQHHGSSAAISVLLSPLTRHRRSSTVMPVLPSPTLRTGSASLVPSSPIQYRSTKANVFVSTLKYTAISSFNFITPSSSSSITGNLFSSLVPTTSAPTNFPEGNEDSVLLIALQVPIATNVDTNKFKNEIEERLNDVYRKGRSVERRRRRRNSDADTSVQVKDVSRTGERVDVRYIVIDDNKIVPAEDAARRMNFFTIEKLSSMLEYSVLMRPKPVPKSVPTDNVVGMLVKTTSQGNLSLPLVKNELEKELVRFYKLSGKGLQGQDMEATIIRTYFEELERTYLEFVIIVDNVTVNRSVVRQVFDVSINDLTAALKQVVLVAPYIPDRGLFKPAIMDYIIQTMKFNNVKDLEAIKGDLSTKLSRVYVAAKQKGSSKRKKRALGSIDSVITQLRRTEGSQADVTFYIIDGDSILNATYACSVLNRLNTNEMSLTTSPFIVTTAPSPLQPTTVTTAPSPLQPTNLTTAPSPLQPTTGETSEDDGHPSWMIPVILASSVGLLLLIIITILYCRWKKGAPSKKIQPGVSSPRVEQSERPRMTHAASPNRDLPRPPSAARTSVSFEGNGTGSLKRPPLRKLPVRENSVRKKVPSRENLITSQTTRTNPAYAEEESGEESVTDMSVVQNGSLPTNSQARKKELEVPIKRHPPPSVQETLESEEGSETEVSDGESILTTRDSVFTANTDQHSAAALPTVAVMSDIPTPQQQLPLRFRTSVHPETSLPPLNMKQTSLVARVVEEEGPIQQQMKNKADIERWRNKQRQREKMRGESPSKPRQRPSFTEKKAWSRAQQEIGSVLDPEAMQPIVRKKKRKPRRKYNMKTETTDDEENVKLRSFNTLNSPREEKDKDREQDSQSESEISLGEARRRMIALLDDAFVSMKINPNKHTSKNVDKVDGSVNRQAPQNYPTGYRPPLYPRPASLTPALPEPPPAHGRATNPSARHRRRFLNSQTSSPYPSHFYPAASGRLQDPGYPPPPPVITKDPVVVWDSADKERLLNQSSYRPYPGNPYTYSDPSGKLHFTPVHRTPDGMGGLVWTPYTTEYAMEDFYRNTGMPGTLDEKNASFLSQMQETPLGTSPDHVKPVPRDSVIDMAGSGVGSETGTLTAQSAEPLVRAIKDELFRLSVGRTPVKHL